ncbi:MAG TPA: hypothetical protein VJ727_10235 [Rhodanobacteraceae bacterium]|nr:hypothetical protein [Rhodanobacteraceae bacterium]
MTVAEMGRARAFALKAALSATLIALGVVPAGPALAGAAVLTPTDTPFSSTADRMISYREEEHSWQTPDGAFHLMINRGDQPSDDALQLYTTLDGGANWITGPSLEASNEYSTQDGMLRGKTLALVYSTDTQAVAYKSYVWDPVSATWNAGDAQTVYSVAGQQAINPCIARDDAGNLWVPLVVMDSATNTNSIRMMVKLFGTSDWIDTGLVFGDVDGPDVERSARPIAIPGGMGMVYTVHDEMYWATRDNSAAPTTPWATQLLYTYTGPHSDPFSSHFSLVGDNRGNVHLALVDNGRLLYLRYNDDTETWKQRWLTNDIDAGYPQVSLVNNTLVIAVNNSSNAGVFVSPDLGKTFTYSYALKHGTPGEGVSYRYPRLETPATSSGPMLLFQQYTENDVDQLIQFTVPIGTDGPSSK